MTNEGIVATLKAIKDDMDRRFVETKEDIKELKMSIDTMMKKSDDKTREILNVVQSQYVTKDQFQPILRFFQIITAAFAAGMVGAFLKLIGITDKLGL